MWSNYYYKLNQIQILQIQKICLYKVGCLLKLQQQIFYIFQDQFIIIYLRAKNIAQIAIDMPLDQQYRQALQKYMQQITPKSSISNSPVAPTIVKLMKSQSSDSWAILKQILAKFQHDQHYYRQLLDLINKYIQEVQSFTMLMFIYWLKVVKKLYNIRTSHIRFMYKNTCLENNEIFLFSLWTQSQPNAEIVQLCLGMIIEIFPIFLKEQYLDLSEQEINCLIQWVAFYHTPSSLQYEQAMRVAQLTKQTRTVLMQDFTEKGQVILKRLIQIAGKFKECSPNVFLFIYPFTMSEKDVSYFCHVYNQFLLDLSEDSLINFFTAITRSAMRPEIIYIIDKISLLLKNQQCFYKLRVIYQKFILPSLVRRAKTCDKVQSQLYRLCQFYALGLLKHCDIGEKGIDCITRNVGKVSNPKVQDMWVRLCFFICREYPQHKQYATKQLLKQLGNPYAQPTFDIAPLISNPEIVWDVTVRNGRKLKQYTKIASSMRGITNDMNECYIITIVQALFRCILFPEMLRDCERQINPERLLAELSILFQELSGSRKAKTITVSYLKNKGPPQFIKNEGQQDAYEYLVQLFDMIQNQLKPFPAFLKRFKQIYQVKCEITSTCSNCKNKKQIDEKSYSFTIPNSQILQESTSQILADFQCDKCNSVCQCQLAHRLRPTSQILIVHINRFSHHKGVAKKQLSTQKILRQFLQYSLVGMICHRGKNVEHGHYVYYHRISSTRWAVFNDNVVQQFELDAKDEQFERQWKLEMTPYLLIYQKLQ